MDEQKLPRQTRANPTPPQDYYNADLPTSTLAIISLITGILGIISPIPFVLSIAAVWTGYAARKATRAIPPKAAGDRLATAGIIMGWLQIILGLSGFLCLLTFYALDAYGIKWWPFQ